MVRLADRFEQIDSYLILITAFFHQPAIDLPLLGEDVLGWRCFLTGLGR
jgi:hypothetical protein